MFTLQKESTLGRRGQLITEHGTIETPFFMTVGTCGAVKGLSQQNIHELGAQVMLCNTYHMMLRPGEDTVEQAGGLHQFAHWNKPMLTDSGGFQIFSFGKKGRTKVSNSGVKFQSHIDGAEHFIGPKESITIQHKLGADMIMAFDECPPGTATKKEVEKAVDRTLEWAKICKNVHEDLKKKRGTNPLLFGIVQGGKHEDLRKKCTEELQAIGFDGYAIGGVSVGEPEEEIFAAVEVAAPLLPADKPRYLMGVGTPRQMRHAIGLGIDMFDCVLPVRLGRHGTLWMPGDTEIKILNAPYKTDFLPIDETSTSPLSREHTKAYLHHLLKASERYGETIAASHNLALVLEMFRNIRDSI